MNGVCFRNIEEVACIELPDPVIEDPGDALVRVEMAGLCGSDLHPFFGREQGLEPGTVMGHEFVGQVVETGLAATRHPVGTRVAAPFTTNCGTCYFCQRGLTSRCVESELFGWRSSGSGLHGGQAELVRVPNANGTLMDLQDKPAEIGLLLGDNLSTGYYCAEMAGTGPEGVFGVIGCGTVGLLCVLSCFARGATRVLAMDPQPQRLARAGELGAETFSDAAAFRAAVFEATEGRGADAVMEVVGLPAAQELAFQCLRPGGIMSVIGCHCTPNFTFSPVDAYDKNLTYRTGRCPARHYMGRLDDVVKRHESELMSLVTHRFTLDQGIEAYDVFANRKDGCIKAVFEL
ncbi:MAG: alcohol dehydrogenase catalytic domain-containing protein [Pirellulaceae bacterium]